MDECFTPCLFRYTVALLTRTENMFSTSKNVFSCFIQRVSACDRGSTACGRHPGRALRNTGNCGPEGYLVPVGGYRTV